MKKYVQEKRNKVIRGGVSIRPKKGPMKQHVKMALLSSRVGIKHSEETKIKMRESQRRRINDVIRRSASDRMIKFYSIPENRLRHSIKLSNETRKKMSISAMGKIQSIETRIKRSNTIKNMWRDENFIKKMVSSTNYSSRIESDFADILDIYGIEYQRQFPITNIGHPYPCDFYLEKYNAIVELDGTYWHNYPHGREIDKIRTRELIDAGYKVLRIWIERDVCAAEDSFLSFIKEIDCSFQLEGSHNG